MIRVQNNSNQIVFLAEKKILPGAAESFEEETLERYDTTAVKAKFRCGDLSFPDMAPTKDAPGPAVVTPPVEPKPEDSAPPEHTGPVPDLAALVNG